MGGEKEGATIALPKAVQVLVYGVKRDQARLILAYTHASLDIVDVSNRKDEMWLIKYKPWILFHSSHFI